MKDLIIWVIHTPAGTVAIISALTALFAKKGTPIHRKAGTYFTISMLIMLVSGSVAAILKQSLDEIFLGGVVIYSVFTAWLTVYHKKGETGFLETIALAWIVLIAIAAYFANPSWGDMRNPDTYSLWIGLAICFALGDVRNLLQSGLSGSQRIIRHVWRIGFSLLWAALAFVDKIVKINGSTIEEITYIVIVPAILILLTTAYWIVNILYLSNKKFAKY
ncbi:MAG: hypothetical protein V7749_09155 [Cocleimonas sp.]